MADIEVVVKMNEYTYQRFIDGFADEDDAPLIEELFKNGTPLPKGHGRLIDADDVNNHIVGYVYLNSCPTIIEADKGNKE